MRRRPSGVERTHRHMPDHQARAARRQHIAERTPVGGLEFADRRIEIGIKMVRVGAHAAQSGKVLHGRTDASGFEAMDVGASDRAHLGRIIGDRTLIGQCVEIELIALGFRPKVEHRGEIEVDTKRCQFASMDTPELLGFCLSLIRRQLRQRGKRGQPRQRRREVRDDAAFLIRRDHQRRQP
ncbi:hypothetical protein chiPu_0031186, partial [Chiloscyllium punctatum]|nr:hypothetical protein [Chiloscyllium punctatum]